MVFFSPGGGDCPPLFFLARPDTRYVMGQDQCLDTCFGRSLRRLLNGGVVVEDVLKTREREELHDVVSQYGLYICGRTSAEFIEGSTRDAISSENH